MPFFHGAQATDASFGTFNEIHPGATQKNDIKYIINAVDRLQLSTSSRFDSLDIETCLEGTRKEILNDLDCWINTPEIFEKGLFGDLYNRVARWITINNRSEAHPSNSTLPAESEAVKFPRIFWINGLAGTGKTTIAYSVAQKCKGRGILGASFFCSRENANTRDPRLIFTTIADQLGRFHEGFQDKITQVYKVDPEVKYSSVLNQLEELLVKPLDAVRSNFPPCIVIVDALDECTDDNATSVILSSLSRHIDALAPLKFLVTSRPETKITRGFRLPQLERMTQCLGLHEVKLDVVELDIWLYLMTCLDRVKEQWRLSEGWPASQDVQELTCLSSGLFIFASTAVKFIDDPNYSNPRGQLDRLLKTTVTEDSSPHGRLDLLYMQVLTNAFPNISSDLSDRLRNILGTIAVAQYPLSLAVIGQLLELDIDVVRTTITYLGSVLVAPINADRTIRFIHPSFFDFIVDPARCTGRHFVVDPQTQHVLLAQACLRAMQSLKRDICEICDPSQLHSEVEDLPDRIKLHIPPRLQYACRSWHHHLSRSGIPDVLVALLEDFCSKSLLHWVEVCSLLGDLRNALIGLDAICQLVSKKDIVDPDTVELLRDCMRFIREFFPIIDAASSQIYESALPFTPTETALRRMYSHELKHSVKVHCGALKNWDLCIRTIQAHSAGLVSVAVSPDGNCVASGSSDSTVQLWDLTTGSHLQRFDMGAPVSSIVFSHSGALIASGSDDNIVRLWDVTCGVQLAELTGHTSRITSVTFSPNSASIASGSRDATIRIWDVATALQQRVLEGHFRGVNSVAYSPDGSLIISGSDDWDIRLWDAANGATLFTFEGYSGAVTSVAYCPDGSQIASGYWDGTTRIWTANGGELKTFEGHSPVYSIAYSRDGSQILSGFGDHSIQIWHIASDALLTVLNGHTGFVKSIAYSPDGSHLVSGSYDGTIRIWDGKIHSHTSEVESNLLSELMSILCTNTKSDIQLAVTRSHVAFLNHDPTTVELWDAEGTLVSRLMQYCQVSDLRFSPNGVHLAIAVSSSIRFYFVSSGKQLQSLEGDWGKISSSAFSPDGSYFAFTTTDRTVQLCMYNGAYEPVQTLQLACGWSRFTSFNVDLRFSPDGNCIVACDINNATLQIWSVTTGYTTHIFSDVLAPGICFSEDQRSVFLNTRFFVSSVPKLTLPPDLWPKELKVSPRLVTTLGSLDGWLYSESPRQRVCCTPLRSRIEQPPVSGVKFAEWSEDGCLLWSNCRSKILWMSW